ncbi:hypothetical protein HDU87_003134 [Geranomyces variabilis]|uniref:Mediator complex subunit 15 KIX domain-containing protein n=1 Tax=Geranomyces variabilis TaxID=109894 RepID=A0AAD5XQW1_9FUNG|nr:hypothetical protein HDU87_003134 [Geranomyces variabilis]
MNPQQYMTEQQQQLYMYATQQQQLLQQQQRAAGPPQAGGSLQNQQQQQNNPTAGNGGGSGGAGQQQQQQQAPSAAQPVYEWQLTISTDVRQTWITRLASAIRTISASSGRGSHINPESMATTYEQRTYAQSKTLAEYTRALEGKMNGFRDQIQSIQQAFQQHAASGGPSIPRPMAVPPGSHAKVRQLVESRTVPELQAMARANNMKPGLLELLVTERRKYEMLQQQQQSQQLHAQQFPARVPPRPGQQAVPAGRVLSAQPMGQPTMPMTTGPTQQQMQALYQQQQQQAMAPGMAQAHLAQQHMMQQLSQPQSSQALQQPQQLGLQQGRPAPNQIPTASIIQQRLQAKQQQQQQQLLRGPQSQQTAPVARPQGGPPPQNGPRPPISLTPQEKAFIQQRMAQLKSMLDRSDELMGLLLSWGTDADNINVRKILSSRMLCLQQIQGFATDTYVIPPAEIEAIQTFWIQMFRSAETRRKMMSPGSAGSVGQPSPQDMHHQPRPQQLETTAQQQQQQPPPQQAKQPQKQQQKPQQMHTPSRPAPDQETSKQQPLQPERSALASAGAESSTEPGTQPVLSKYAQLQQELRAQAHANANQPKKTPKKRASVSANSIDVDTAGEPSKPGPHSAAAKKAAQKPIPGKRAATKRPSISSGGAPRGRRTSSASSLTSHEQSGVVAAPVPQAPLMHPGAMPGYPAMGLVIPPPPPMYALGYDGRPIPAMGPLVMPAHPGVVPMGMPMGAMPPPVFQAPRWPPGWMAARESMSRIAPNYWADPTYDVDTSISDTLAIEEAEQFVNWEGEEDVPPPTTTAAPQSASSAQTVSTAADAAQRAERRFFGAYPPQKFIYIEGGNRRRILSPPPTPVTTAGLPQPLPLLSTVAHPAVTLPTPTLFDDRDAIGAAGIKGPLSPISPEKPWFGAPPPPPPTPGLRLNSGRSRKRAHEDDDQQDNALAGPSNVKRSKA